MKSIVVPGANMGTGTIRLIRCCPRDSLQFDYARNKLLARFLAAGRPQNFTRLLRGHAYGHLLSIGQINGLLISDYLADTAN
jgi:hypothetical protein